MSASFAGSSIWLIETRTSGGIFLLSLMYCSNCATTVRASASSSWRSPRLVGDRLGVGLEESLVIGEALDAGALSAFDQHLHGAVGQLQQLQHGADGADRIDVAGRRIVLRRVLLGDEQNLLVVLHNVFERAHRLLATNEERHNHVREHNDVAKRQDRVQIAAGCIEHGSLSRYAETVISVSRRPPMTQRRHEMPV